MSASTTLQVGPSPPEGAEELQELERKAEQELSERLRSQRLTLKQRQAAADAAHLDPVPLFTACIQWPGVMEMLQETFQEKLNRLSRRGGFHTTNDVASDSDSSDEQSHCSSSRGVLKRRALRDKQSSPSLAVPPGTVGEKEFVDRLWLCVLTMMQKNRGQVSPAEETFGAITDLGSSTGDTMNHPETSPSTKSPVEGSPLTPALAVPPSASPKARTASVALRHVTPAFERHHKTQFRRVFRLCDPRRSGGITWAALTSYLLDSAMFMKCQRDRTHALADWYEIREPIETGAHRPRHLKWVAGTEDVLVVDASGSVYRFATETHASWAVEFRKPGAPPPQLLLLIDAEAVPAPDLGVCFSTVGAELYYFDLTFKILERVTVPDSIQSLVWHIPSKLLVAGDREGRVSFWKIKKLNPARRNKAPVLVRSFTLHAGVAIQVLTCARRKDLLVAGYENGHVFVFTGTGVIIRTFVTTSGTLNSLSLSEHQEAIVCGTVLFQPEMWMIDGSGGNTPFVLHARVVPHVSPIVSVVCMQSEPQFISMDYAGVAKVWHMQLLQCLQTFVIPKHDPRSSWRSLVEVNGYVLFTDRLHVRSLHVVEEGDPLVEKRTGSKLIEHAVVQRGATTALVRLPNMRTIVSSCGDTLVFWDEVSQRSTAELNPTQSSESITTITLDTAHTRMFLGTDRGSVWIVSVSTGGVLECFSRVHSAPVASIGFLDHVGFGISCSVLGDGVFLQSPAKVQVTDPLHQRGQNAFTEMDTGIMVVVGEPWMVVVAADRRHYLHFFSTREVAAITKLQFLTAGALPDAASFSGRRRSSFRWKKPDDSEFQPKSRRVVDIKHIPRSDMFLLLVADNMTVSIMALHNSGGTQAALPPVRPIDSVCAVLLACWAIATEFEGNISAIGFWGLTATDYQNLQDALLERRSKSPSTRDVLGEADNGLVDSMRFLLNKDDDAQDEIGVLAGSDHDDASPGACGLAGPPPAYSGGLTLHSSDAQDPRQQQGQHDNHPPADTAAAVAAPLDGGGGDDGCNPSDFQRAMGKLYESQRQQNTVVLDPQCVLLNCPNASAAAGLHRLLDDAQVLLVAFENGAVALFDITQALLACVDDDVIDADLFPLRFCKLQTTITAMEMLSPGVVGIGRADGLVDLLEAPSLGLLWSGLVAIAESADYFPPTGSIAWQENATTVIKSSTTVQRAKLARIKSYVTSSFASSRSPASFRRSIRVHRTASIASDRSSIAPETPATLDSATARVQHSVSKRIPTTTLTLEEREDVSDGDVDDGTSSSTQRPSAFGDVDSAAKNRKPVTKKNPLQNRHGSGCLTDHQRAPSADDSVWILGQLSTLLGDRSIIAGRGAVGESPHRRSEMKLLRHTPSGIPVYQGNDPFAECESADPTGVAQESRAAPVLRDHRKTQKERQQERFSIRNKVDLKSYEELGVSRPSSSRSFVSTVESLPSHVPIPAPRGSLLRPLCSTPLVPNPSVIEWGYHADVSHIQRPASVLAGSSMHSLPRSLRSRGVSAGHNATVAKMVRIVRTPDPEIPGWLCK